MAADSALLAALDRLVTAATALPTAIKGPTVRVFDSYINTAAGAGGGTAGVDSDHPVDCRGYNAIFVAVQLVGTSPVVTLKVKGERASGGNYLLLAGSEATQSGLTTSQTFDVSVGSAWVKINLSSLTGTFLANGQGVTVDVTPYIRSGQTNVTIANTAAENIAQVGGVTVGVTNPLFVELSNGSVALGTASAPVRTDPTGTTTQPVSGTVTANIGTAGTLALDASVTGLQVAQGSATSGQKGGLALGAVTTAAPTYTTAQTSPLSLTTAGALRVDGSAVTQPVSGTVSTTPPTGASGTQVQGTAAAASAPVGNPVQVGGSDGVTMRALGVDTSGRLTVVGAAAVAGLPAGNPLRVAGLDGTNLRDLLTDTSGRLQMVGPAAAGSPPAGNPLQVAGSDGTNMRTLSTDTSGRIVVGGPVANGLAPTGNPVLIGGWDGSFTQQLRADGFGRLQVIGGAAGGAAIAGNPVRVAANNGGTTTEITVDASGRLLIAGAAASGAAVAGSPVRVGGSDGTNTRDISTDTSGRLSIVGPGAAGAAPVGNPLQVAGSDGTNLRTLRTATDGTVRIDPVGTTTQPVNVVGAATGGASKAKLRNLSSTVTAIKASAGTLYGLLVLNNQAATAAYIQVFDLATGSVTLGTTTPDFEILAAANSTQWYPFSSQGAAFGTAISAASTTTEGGLTGSAAGVMVFPIYA